MYQKTTIAVYGIQIISDPNVNSNNKYVWYNTVDRRNIDALRWLSEGYTIRFDHIYQIKTFA